jgi:dihydrofolate synthase/folylpolyglutamate synthase
MVYLPHFPKPNKNSINKNSTEKLLEILDRLGNPHNKLPKVIHIAGTNGKGSTAAFLTSILQNAGYKIHLYTSPHLHNVNERIVISGHQIDDGYLYEILEEVRIATNEINLTLFEGLTLAAILAFSKNPADFCVIETGMGGRICPTNIIENKIATILTSISLDHQEFLGNNLEEIACEKAYIMRPNIPCIIASNHPVICKAIEARSREISNQLIYFNKDFKITINDNETFNFTSQEAKLNNLNKPALLGLHQYLNASLAIACASLILKLSYYPPLPPQIQLSSQRGLGSTTHNKANPDYKDAQKVHTIINNGLKQVKWPSRLQRLTYKQLRKDDELWIDGAHNEGGFLVLSDWIKEQIVDDIENYIIKRNYLIVGFTKGKAKSRFFSFFKDIIDFICAVRVYGEPNPESADIISKKINLAEIKEVKEENDLDEAIDFLVNLDPKNPCRIVICGSLYLARDFKRINI